MEKNKHIETLRGIAILLVILYHVCEYLKLPGVSLWRQSHIPFDYLRMPLFTVISGFVYALRPVQMDSWKQFARKKFIRLFLPLISWAAITYLAYTLAFSQLNLSELLASIFYPYMQFWFLQVLIFVFAIVLILEKFQVLYDFKSWLITLAICLGATFFYVYAFPGEVTTPLVSMTFFSYSGVFYLLPYFLLGIGIKRFLYMKIAPKYLVILGIIFIVGVVCRELYALDMLRIKNLKKDGVFGMFFGLASTILVMNIKVENKFLAAIGSLAYPIYLIHLTAILIGATVIFNMGLYNNKIVFPFMIICGVFIPVVLMTIIDLHPLSRLLFFGTRRKCFPTYFYSSFSLFDFKKKKQEVDVSPLYKVRQK